MSTSDRDTLFHRKWLGYAEPIEGLVFSVQALVEAQIAPDERKDLSAAFEGFLAPDATDAGGKDAPRIANLARFLKGFLGYAQEGALVPEHALPPELTMFTPSGKEELRPTFAIARTLPKAHDPFAEFDEAPATVPASPDGGTAAERFAVLVWDVTSKAHVLDLDKPEVATCNWSYSPTGKFERLLRHAGVPVGLLFSGTEIRIVYAPKAEATGHLTFRVAHMRGAEGRTLLGAMELVLGARRMYGAAESATLEGLLIASRRAQGQVTEELAAQVFEAVEIVVAGFEAAARRDAGADRHDWLRPALEADGDHFYQGVLSVVLRLVFLLYAEDQSLMPVEHPLFAQNLSVVGLYERLHRDRDAHPESMPNRFGAYGHLLALFRAVFFGVKHGSLSLPPRSGRLFDPNSYPFLEGGLPEWTAAVVDPSARAAVRTPSVDDGTVFEVLERLVRLGGQRLSYRTLDVEQIGSVYESLMGFHVQRVDGDALRVGSAGVWIDSERFAALTPADRARFLKEEAKGASPKVSEALLGAAAQGPAALAASFEDLAGKRPRDRVHAGALVLQPGEERRRSGSHYTPRTLTEKVVARTLEPILACLGAEPKPEQILDLKICDPAMGSGAFLVAACRALATELVNAWAREPAVLKAIVDEHGDAHLHARRLVAQQCLYGVDKNAAAVELAKLSLWLVTLSRTLPFTFVDHALRHGDSLVGLDFQQIESFHWQAGKQLETCRALLHESLGQAVTLRRELHELSKSDDPVAQAEKRRLFEFAQQAIDRIRLAADVCVGAFFAEAKDAAREKERKRRLDIVERWLRSERLAEDAENDDARGKAEAQANDARQELEGLAAEVRAKVAPFHWWIEFPEVFYEARPDPLQSGAVNGAAMFEAVVGNPPFGGKNNIAASNAEGFVDWLKVVSPGAHGNADLSAHFFRRAAVLLGEHGTFGLIATNTISQGDTRESGLAALVRAGWVLYDATDSMPWPGAAAVTVSIVHAAKGEAVSRLSSRRLGGALVPMINSMLKTGVERENPTPLAPNGDAAFAGTNVLGLGFTLTPAERDALVAEDPRNAERIFPYLGGEEVNTSPTQSFDRYVISFGQMSLEEAERWPDLIAIVREKVKPERDKNNRENYRLCWWQFGEARPGLYAAIAPLERCIVTSGISKHRVFAFVSADWVFSHNLYVFPLWSVAAWATLQSRVHTAWAALLSSGLEDRGGYRPSNCFETFPFPKSDPRTVIPELEAAGEALYAARASFMVDTNQGLTKTYNALKDANCTDARVLELRRLHEAMDRAVLAAYGWSDLDVPPFCPRDDDERAALKRFEEAVIDRLYALNAERAKEEALLGAGAKAAKPKATGTGDDAAKPRRGRLKKGDAGNDPSPQGALF
jgi:hypothetical protein